MTKYYLFVFSLLLVCSLGCGNETSSKKDDKAADKTETAELDPMKDKGVGPIKNLELAETIDEEMAKNGEEIYVLKCSACHKVDKTYIGPAPKGIFERRTPEWIMNMILNPEVMIVENEAAKKLLMEFNGSPMANQNLTEEEARAILEYFRTIK